MTSVEPRPLSSDEPSVWDALQRRHFLYLEIEGHEAFKDYVYRLTQVRQGIVASLLRGDPDAKGHKHDDEKRLLLEVLDKILDVPSLAHRQWEAVDRQKRVAERNRPRPDAPIHGFDTMRP